MARQLRFNVETISDVIKVSIEGLSLPVAKAATATIKDAAKLLKTTARAHIARAGFSSRWQNAYRVTVYPEKGFSVDAAAFGVFKSIEYSDIFATGGKITGSPLLWIPLKGAPKFDRRKTNADIKDYQQKGIKLYSIKGSNPPLLAASITMTKSQAKKKVVRITVSDLLKGQKKSTSRKGTKLVTRLVPLFVGESSITIKKRFDWAIVQDAVQNRVPALYDQQIAKLAGK